LNSKYNALSQKDINEIENVLEYANGLILKDTETAEAKESMSSYRSSNQYINARLNLSEMSDELRQSIIDGYTELNPYYKELYTEHRIDYLTSRTAKDLHILTAKNPTLTREEVNLFYECYYEVLNYHNKVTSTKAFKNQDMYRGFIKLFLIFSTVQKYLTRKMENFFNIDVYDEVTLKNAFISVGLDYFEDMPVNYQRRLLKMVNTLLANKGTNKAITQIVELFGFNNIDIYRYVLAKGYTVDPLNGKLDYDNPYLMFFKTPADKEVDFKKDMMLSFESVTAEDPYWHASREETSLIPFNFVNSKYMSVDTTIDAMTETIGLAYFMSILYEFQLEYKEKEGYDFGFMNKNISKNIVNIYDAIIALQSLIVKSHGYEDTITKNPDVINYIYGYRDIENKIDIGNILEEIQVLLIKYPRVANRESIQTFIDTFRMTAFGDRDKYSIEQFLEVFKANEAMREELEQLLVDTDNYYIYRKLQDIWDIEMRTKINTRLYGDADTFSEYLRRKNYDLYTYIQLPPNTEGNEKHIYNFYKERIFDITESISNYISDLKVRQYFLNNNFVGLSSYIEKYLYTAISLFKAYTIDLLSANIVFAFNDKAFNTLKLFDDYQLTVDLDFAERVDLLDVWNILESKNVVNEVVAEEPTSDDTGKAVDGMSLGEAVKITVEDVIDNGDGTTTAISYNLSNQWELEDPANREYLTHDGSDTGTPYKVVTGHNSEGHYLASTPGIILGPTVSHDTIYNKPVSSLIKRIGNKTFVKPPDSAPIHIATHKIGYVSNTKIESAKKASQLIAPVVEERKSTGHGYFLYQLKNKDDGTDGGSNIGTPIV
jgi:hypothetical protein